jgi:hypothetical protein
MYNSLVRLVLPVIALFLLFSCAKDINNKDAVRDAVLRRLETVSGLNLAGMDVDITNVSFQGNSAEAKVAFRAKGSADAMLNMSYKLEREGDVWVVKSTSGGMGGGGGAFPPGHPPAQEGSSK